MAKDRKTGAEAAQTFAKMAVTFNEWLRGENFLSAYVVAFSFAEDRVDVMWAATRERLGLKKQSRYVPATTKLEYLVFSGDCPRSLLDAFEKENAQRNTFVHAAMWNHDAIKKSDCHRVMKLAREASALREKQKRAAKRRAKTTSADSAKASTAI